MVLSDKMSICRTFCLFVGALWYKKGCTTEMVQPCMWLQLLFSELSNHVQCGHRALVALVT